MCERLTIAVAWQPTQAPLPLPHLLPIPQVEALCKQSERRVAAYRADVAALPTALAALAKRSSAAAADVRQLLIAGQVWARGVWVASTPPAPR